jgi:hypothetical protein
MMQAQSMQNQVQGMFETGLLKHDDFGVIKVVDNPAERDHINMVNQSKKRPGGGQGVPNNQAEVNS